MDLLIRYFAVFKKKFRFIYSFLFVFFINLLILSIGTILFFTTRDYFLLPKVDRVIEGVLVPTLFVDNEVLFNVDPLLTDDYPDEVLSMRQNLNYLLFPTLFSFDRNRNLKENIVQSYKKLSNQTYQITIKNNLIWSDGQEITSRDIAFTISVIKQLSSRTPFIENINNGAISITENDKYTFTIDLVAENNTSKPNPFLIEKLVFPILPAHKLENYLFNNLVQLSSSDFGFHPVTAGKYFIEQKTNDEIRLRKNTKYWFSNDLPNEYCIKIYRDSEKLTLDLRLGNIDIFRDINISYDDKFNEIYTRDIYLTSNLLGIYFNLKNSNSFFSENSVIRKSYLSLLAKQIFEQKKNIDILPISKKSIFYDESYTNNIVDYGLKTLEDDLAKLKFIKNNNGIYEKDGVELSYRLTLLDDPRYKAIFEIIEKNSLKLGIKLIPDLKTSQDYDNLIRNRNFEAIVFPYKVSDDLYTHWHTNFINYPGLNIAAFGTNTTDLLLVESRFSEDLNIQKDYYKKFLTRYFEEMPAIGVDYGYIRLVLNKKAKLTQDVEYIYSSVQLIEIIRK